MRPDVVGVAPVRNPTRRVGGGSSTADALLSQARATDTAVN